jgi:uncharacterized protein YdaU (DUF1376 family)
VSKADAWMPLYIGDYLSDTMHLTCEQSGAYLHLIMHYWRAGSLPDNDVALAQIARLPLKAWKAHRPIVAAFFGSGWTHKRIDAERQKTSEVKERYHERAVKAAQARHKKPSTNATSNGHASLKDRNSHLQGSNEPIESSNEDLSVEPTEKPLTKSEVIGAWQDRMVPLGFPPIRKMTGQRERQLNARLKDSTLDEWLKVFSALERSNFCRGENDRGWRADFDFLLQPKSFTKLLEGAYDH